MSESIFSDDFKTTPFWWEAAPRREIGASTLPDYCDVAIVGSGYSGLSAALELARSGLSVTVIEQNELGWGASSRNGGMLSGEPKFAAPATLVSRFGRERAERILEDGRATASNLKEVVEREGIDCYLQNNGRFVGAHSPRAYRQLARKADELSADGFEGFDLIPPERQSEVTESNYYYGGLLEHDGGCLHPGLYHQGLLEACERNGVVLCPGLRVEQVKQNPEGFVLQASDQAGSGRGVMSCKAQEVVIGTNGYTSEVTPWHRRRLVPLGSYIIATEELPKERVESMFRNFCTMSNTQRILFYYRPSPDYRRVIFGGRASFRSTTEHDSSRKLHQYLCEVFPSLRGVQITHGWTGNVAFTFDHLPHMGVHDGMHYCMGCNGSGVQMMSFLGRQIALKILGRTNRPCGFDEIPFESRPLYTGNPWFLPVLGNWYRMRDRIDRLLA